MTACLVVEHDEIPPAHVEAAEVVNSRFSVVDVVVHHEGRPPCVLPVPQPDLWAAASAAVPAKRRAEGPAEKQKKRQKHQQKISSKTTTRSTAQAAKLQADRKQQMQQHRRATSSRRLPCVHSRSRAIVAFYATKDGRRKTNEGRYSSPCRKSRDEKGSCGGGSLPQAIGGRWTQNACTTLQLFHGS